MFTFCTCYLWQIFHAWFKEFLHRRLHENILFSHDYETHASGSEKLQEKIEWWYHPFLTQTNWLFKIEEKYGLLSSNYVCNYICIYDNKIHFIRLCKVRINFFTVVITKVTVSIQQVMWIKSKVKGKS